MIKMIHHHLTCVGQQESDRLSQTTDVPVAENWLLVAHVV